MKKKTYPILFPLPQRLLWAFTPDCRRILKCHWREITHQSAPLPVRTSVYGAVRRIELLVHAP